MKEQPLKTNIEPELVMREMLLHDVYELPNEPDDLLVTCSCCGETGLGLKAVTHQPWCIYANGQVSPEVTN